MSDEMEVTPYIWRKHEDLMKNGLGDGKPTTVQLKE